MDRGVMFRKRHREFMQTVVTVTVLGVSAYLIVERSASADARNWAFSAISAIVGYWLGNHNSGGL